MLVGRGPISRNNDKAFTSIQTVIVIMRGGGGVKGELTKSELSLPSSMFCCLVG